MLFKYIFFIRPQYDSTYLRGRQDLQDIQDLLFIFLKFQTNLRNYNLLQYDLPDLRGRQGGQDLPRLNGFHIQ